MTPQVGAGGLPVCILLGSVTEGLFGGSSLLSFVGRLGVVEDFGSSRHPDQQAALAAPKVLSASLPVASLGPERLAVYALGSCRGRAFLCTREPVSGNDPWSLRRLLPFEGGR